MAKKISSQNLEKAKENLHKVKRLQVIIDDDTYDIKVLTHLTTIHKENLLTNLQLYLSHFDIEEVSEMIIASIAIIQTITDIDFPSDPDEALDLFYLLIDLKIVERVINSISDELNNEINATFEMAAEFLPKLYEQELTKDYGEQETD